MDLGAAQPTKINRQRKEPIFKNIQELVEGLTKDPKIQSDLTKHLENLQKSGEVVLSEVSPKNCKFSRGDIVRNMNTGDIGFVVGPLNSFPGDTGRLIEENAGSNPRYLMIILNPSHSEFGKIWEKVTGVSKGDEYGSLPKGYFSIRYPSEKHLELLLRRENKNTQQDVSDYCTYHCVMECDSTCPLHKHGFGTEETL